MFEFILGQLAFAYGFHEVHPTAVVDKLIEFAVDVLTPGKGTGENTWWMKSLRGIERRVDRTSRELDMRADLRRWDDRYPYLHHELLVRYAAGLLSSAVAMFLYDTVRGLVGGGGNGRPSRRGR